MPSRKMLSTMYMLVPPHTRRPYSHSRQSEAQHKSLVNIEPGGPFGRDGRSGRLEGYDTEEKGCDA